MAREQTIEVLMAGYFSKVAASEDAASVRASKADLVGLVVVSKDLEGNVAVEEQDQAVRKGVLTLGGAGFVVGLFAPPLLAATAIGAALGAGVGKTVQHKIKAGIEQQGHDSIPIGSAGLIVAYPSSSGAAVEAAVTRAITRVIGEGTGSRKSALTTALADAQGKMAEPANGH
jgi:arylsulfatase